jgi:tetratricopeptide (TPR) repeat protein
MAPAEIRYRAFLSYSSADSQMGVRLQRAIESYRIPKPLRGTDRGLGPVPKRLTPLFRDRTDANAGANLTEKILMGLHRSDALVVLCSPAAAKSEWVNTEIRRFKSLGRSERVVAVLLDGDPWRFDPYTATNGAFPPALFERVDATGAAIAGDEPEPLAADVRESADGFDLAKLKVVASLTGVPLTELTQRHLEAERRDRKIVRRVATAITALSLAVCAAAILAYSSERTARLRFTQAIDIAARQVDEAGRFGYEYGVPTRVVTQLLAGADADFATMADNNNRRSGVPALDVQRARLFAVFADVFGNVGDRARQFDRAQRSLNTLEGVDVSRHLLRPRGWFAVLPGREEKVAAEMDALAALAAAIGDASAPDDPYANRKIVALLERGRDLAVRERSDPSRFWSLLGEFHYTRGDLRTALAEQSKAVEALESLKGEAHLPELAYALSRRAEFRLESEQPSEALTDHKRALAILEPLAAAKPSDGEVQRNLAATLTQYADALYATCGSWTAARPIHERAVGYFRRARQSNRDRLDYATDLGIALEHLGDVLLQTNEIAGARGVFDELLELREGLLSRDPENAEARRDLGIAYERQGAVAMAEKSKAAVAWFDKLRQVLESRDSVQEAPNPILRRDLAVAWDYTAKARARFKNGQSWEDAHREAIRIMDELVHRADAPLGWLRDLAVFHIGYAESLSGAGRTADARSHYTKALVLIERQLSEVPDDPRLPADRDLVRSRLGLKIDRPVPPTPTARPECQGAGAGVG